MIPVALSVFIILCISISSYIVKLQGMETYPTCLRQTGTSFGTIVGSSFGILGPYIVYLVISFFN
jgi:OCT family organic cation transporter-like MFS transporter 4/5